MSKVYSSCYGIIKEIQEEDVKRGTLREIVWTDDVGLRRRRSYLILVHEGQAIPFAGRDVDGVCHVVDVRERQGYKENGRDFTILLEAEVMAFAGRQDFVTGNIIGDVESWAQAASWFGNASVDSLRETIRFYCPEEAEEMDQMEAHRAIVLPESK